VDSPVVVAGRFVSGAGLLLRGLGLWARTPGLVLLGVVPSLITGVVFLAAFVALGFFVGDLADFVTPFADDWSAWARRAMRVAAALALLGLGGLIAVVTFTAVTLAVGDPFYERISAHVEARCGGVPETDEVSWARSLRRGVADSARLVGCSVLVGVLLFPAGFLPVVGQTAVPVLAAAVGGWLLALELVAAPFYRRGLRLADRRRALRAVRPQALGFGVAVFIVFLIPLGAVLFIPAAVAGATLLARRSLGEPADVG
jgi:CysZ protein